MSPVPYDRDDGAVNAFACSAFCGWEMIAAMMRAIGKRAIGVPTEIIVGGDGRWGESGGWRLRWGWR